MNEEEFDVVIDTLQKQIVKLQGLVDSKYDEWGIMDQYRIGQIAELKSAMELWKKTK